MRVKVAVLVSGGGTNLQALLDANLQHGEIAFVLSNRKAAYALERARRRGVETAVLSNVMEPDPVAGMKSCWKCCARAASRWLRWRAIWAFWAKRPFPLMKTDCKHPSGVIPSFCGKGYYGLRVHEAALARGVKVTGATAHLVNLGVDEGPILLQKAVDVLPGDTPETLQKRVMEEAEWKLLPAAVDMVCQWAEEEETL